MSNPDIFSDYDLLQAFLKLALRLYGVQWTPNHTEMQARDCSTRLTETTARKAALEKQISELAAERKTTDAQIGVQTSDGTVKALTKRRDEIVSLASTLRSELAQLPSLEDLRTETEMYDRRKAVEARLIGAIKKREIEIYSALDAFPGDQGPWNDEKGYSYNIELSTVWWAKRAHGKRRQFVRVCRPEFDAWLGSIAPLDPAGFAQLPEADQAKIVTSRLLRETAPQLLKRASFVQHLKVKAGVSRNLATRIWDTEVPANRKHVGRPRGKSAPKG